MQQASDFSTIGLSKTKVMENVQTTVSRLSYIDLARGILIILVIMLHAAVTYGGTGDWTYTDLNANDELSDVLLSLFVICCQSFSMGLYFFFAGYFTPSSYDKKGGLRFWKDRLVHLAIPMVLYTWFLSKVPMYLSQVTNYGLRMPFWQYVKVFFWKHADGGPTWFLFALLCFSIGYTLYRLVTRKMNAEKLEWTKRLPAPNTTTLIMAALVLALLMFIVAQFLPISEAPRAFGIYSVLVSFFPSYIVLFIAGILAHRNDWLTKMSSRLRRFWGWVSIGLIVFLPAFLIGTGAVEQGLDPYLSGFAWRCAVVCLWFGFASIAFSTTLTLWLRDRTKPGSILAKAAGKTSFGIYLIHPLVLVAISVAISSYAIHPLLKFSIASIFTFVLCYALVLVLKSLPVLKKIF